MESITILFLGGLAFFLVYTVVDMASNVKKTIEMKRKGYRYYRGTVFGQGGGYGPDPTQKDTLGEYYWKSRGYRWSEKYHRWYLPKKRGK